MAGLSDVVVNVYAEALYDDDGACGVCGACPRAGVGEPEAVCPVKPMIPQLPWQGRLLQTENLKQ